MFTVKVFAADHAPLAAIKGFCGTLRARSSPLENDPRLLDHAFIPIGVRSSLPAVRIRRVGDVELKSNDTALIPRSLSFSSNHFPESFAESGDDEKPVGNLTASPDNRLSSCLRAAAFSGKRPGFIKGKSLSHTRFITFCMSRTPLVIATTASSSGI